MITKSDLDQGLQDYLASTSNIKADPNKRIRALNAVLDMLSQYNWNFSIKKADFAFTAGTTEYALETTMGITDFKEVFWLDDRDITDSRRFHSDQENISVTIKNRVHYLLCDLDETGTYDFEYFSTHLILNTQTSVTQEHFTLDTATESFIGPANLAPLIIQMGYLELLTMTKNSDKQEQLKVENKVKILLDKAIDQYGYTPKKGKKRIQIKK